MESTIRIVLNSGTTYEYTTTVGKAREHMHAIITTGYRRVEDGVLTWFPPHAITKVTATNQQTQYPDKTSGT